jgi:hypothetical protein
MEEQRNIEKELVIEAINHYFTGASEKKIDELRIAFHPDCVMYFIKDGSLASMNQTQYYDLIQNGPALRRVNVIISVDITGSAAYVKALAMLEEYRFIGHLLLLKIGREWKIISKTIFKVDT